MLRTFSYLADNYIQDTSMFELSLSVLGLVLTIAFGIYSIWTYKKSKRKVNLEFRRVECYSLFREDVNRLNIQLSYNNTPLTSSLILLKAKLINNGQTDIDRTRIYSPLKVIAGSEYKWLEGRITGQPEGATTAVQILREDDSEFEIQWDLLKAQEFIELEALVQVTKDVESEKTNNKAANFYDKLGFDFRITDLDVVQKEKPADMRATFPKMLFILSLIVGLGFLILGFAPDAGFYGLNSQLFPSTGNILFKVSDSATSKVGTIQNDGNSISFKDAVVKSVIKLPISEFNKRFKVAAAEKVVYDNSLLKTLGVIYTLISIFFFWISKRGIKKSQKVVSALLPFSEHVPA